MCQSKDECIFAVVSTQAPFPSSDDTNCEIQFTLIREILSICLEMLLAVVLKYPGCRASSNIYCDVVFEPFILVSSSRQDYRIMQ